MLNTIFQQVTFWADEDVYASPRNGDDDDSASVGSALRKTRSVDASCLDVRSIADLGSPTQGLSRAKSDLNLQASLHNTDQGIVFVKIGVNYTLHIAARAQDRGHKMIDVVLVKVFIEN